MHLYHLYGEFECKKKMRQACAYGLNPNLTSEYLGVGGAGDFFPEIMKQVQLESKSENWIDFSKGIMVKFSPYTFDYYLKFPVFTNKIMVFDLNISSQLFSYIEDEYVVEETGVAGTMIEPGTPKKEVLVKQYWQSRMSLRDYLKVRPMEEAEVMIFESVQKNC